MEVGGGDCSITSYKGTPRISGTPLIVRILYSFHLTGEGEGTSSSIGRGLFSEGRGWVILCNYPDCRSCFSRWSSGHCRERYELISYGNSVGKYLQVPSHPLYFTCSIRLKMQCYQGRNQQSNYTDLHGHFFSSSCKLLLRMRIFDIACLLVDMLVIVLSLCVPLYNELFYEPLWCELPCIQ